MSVHHGVNILYIDCLSNSDFLRRLSGPNNYSYAIQNEGNSSLFLDQASEHQYWGFRFCNHSTTVYTAHKRLIGT